MAACIEKKITLSGAVQEFQCELLHLDTGFGALKHISGAPFGIPTCRD
jgi:hypothetical protein